MSNNLLYCGDNRKRDLKTLIRAFEDVMAYADGAKRNSVPQGGQCKVVLLHAERGLGKTRLTMELYKYLSAHMDPDNYWPDQFEKSGESIAAMPRAENFAYETAPPYLWWGLKVSDNPTTGDTLFSSLRDLLPHLVTMRYAHRRAEGMKSIFSELSSAAVDLGIGIAEDQSGLSAVKRIGEAVTKVGSILRKSPARDAHPLDEAVNHAASVANEVIEDLDRILNPRSKLYAHLPAIVFIDDAQYADRDEGLAAFLERLIVKANDAKWPLLIVITHWSRQLQHHENAKGETVPPSCIARVLHHAQHGGIKVKGEFANQKGGTLSRDQIINIDLGEPVDDLSPAVVNIFPGISASNRTYIVEKTGGNPRKLEQIIEVMKQTPRWFENHDSNHDLTEKGAEEVKNLSRLGIEKIVYARLLDTPADIRRSLAITSLVGSSFVIDFVEKLAKSHIDIEARPNLEKSESVYRFLTGVRETSRNDIGYFSEPLFFDAAKEYRLNARADFEDWPSEAVLFEALDELIGELIHKPENFSKLGLDDISHMLGVAVDRLVSKQSNDTGLALARQVSIENSRGNPEGASAAAIRFMDGFVD